MDTRRKPGFAELQEESSTMKFVKYPHLDKIHIAKTEASKAIVDSCGVMMVQGRYGRTYCSLRVSTEDSPLHKLSDSMPKGELCKHCKKRYMKSVGEEQFFIDCV